MKAIPLLLFSLAIILFTSLRLCAKSDSLEVKLQLLDKILSKQDKLRKRVSFEQLQLVKKIKSQDEKLARRINKIDSVKASLFQKEAGRTFKLFNEKLKDTANISLSKLPYIPKLDSLETLLKWQKSLGANPKVEEALSKIGQLKRELLKEQALQDFIGDRKKSLNAMFSEGGIINSLPIKDIRKYVDRYSKTFYYYKERINNLKETLNRPEKLEQEIIRLAMKIPVFESFIQQNSQLAQMFGTGMSATSSVTSNVAGLQTRSSVLQLLQQQLGTAGANPQQFLNQQLGAAQGELAKLKDKLTALRSGGNGDTDLPDFKPNTQRSKTLAQRIEYGVNIQSNNRVSDRFPSSNDIGLTLGFRFTDRFVMGGGTTYKFGLGDGWKAIKISHEGIGIRTYIDWKLSPPQKGIKVLFSNLWLSGGYEQTYMSRFASVEALRSLSWQRSGLIGISKKIKYKKKELKASVLWDFIEKKTGSSPFVFRYGYTF